MKTLTVILILILMTAISIMAIIAQAHAQLSPGNILVTDLGAGTNMRGALFRVDPSTGARTILSDFGNPDQGPVGLNPNALALNASGNILVTDALSGTDMRGLLFRVDPSNGNRTLITDFGDNRQGPLGGLSRGVAIIPVTCGGLLATRMGTPGDDFIIGTRHSDVIHGLGGDDFIIGELPFPFLGKGNDRICGGPGKDRLFGQRGRDILRGGRGNDRLFGGANNDTLRGGKGDDRMDGVGGIDFCDGGDHINGDTAFRCEDVVNVP